MWNLFHWLGHCLYRSISIPTDSTTTLPGEYCQGLGSVYSKKILLLCLQTHSMIQLAFSGKTPISVHMIWWYVNILFENMIYWFGSYHKYLSVNLNQGKDQVPTVMKRFEFFLVKIKSNIFFMRGMGWMGYTCKPYILPSSASRRQVNWKSAYSPKKTFLGQVFLSILHFGLSP